MRLVLLHEQGPLGETGMTVQGMGHRMDREREHRLHLERLTPKRFRPVIISILRASERGHGEQIFVTGDARGPRRPYQRRDLAQRRPAADGPRRHRPAGRAYSCVCCASRGTSSSKSATVSTATR